MEACCGGWSLVAASAAALLASALRAPCEFARSRHLLVQLANSCLEREIVAVSLGPEGDWMSSS